jgi:phosphohistidine swiveling domain-containing protein
MQKLRPTVKRDLSLFSIQSWQKGYTKYLKKNLNFWYDLIFYYDGEKVNFYHRLSDFDHFKKVVTEKLINNDLLFKKLNKNFQNDVKDLKKLAKNLDLKNLKKISDLIGKIMSFYIFIVSDDFVNRRPEAWTSRYLSEGILYLLDEKIESSLKKLLAKNKQAKNLVHFLNVNEAISILKNKNFDLNHVIARQTGYILFNKNFYTNLSFSKFCSQNKFINQEKGIGILKNNIIKGAIGYKGLATGKVKIIIKKNDLLKIKSGDILVTIMTNASFIPFLKRAKAFITDEGGITCHATIIARELKKPCIIGTRNATKVLHDGNMVEVDANNGIVKILKKSK